MKTGAVTSTGIERSACCDAVVTVDADDFYQCTQCLKPCQAYTLTTCCQSIVQIETNYMRWTLNGETRQLKNGERRLCSHCEQTVDQRGRPTKGARA